MNLPTRFGLHYASQGDSENTKAALAEPVVIHRAILGSTERFLGILIEHYAGAFPLWLAPIQATVLPVSEKFSSYGEKVSKELRESGVRVTLDDANETLGKRIRESELQKIPYVLVVGEKEETNGTINIRHYRRGQEGEIGIHSLVEKIKEEIEKKTI